MVQLADLADQTLLYVTGPPQYWVDSHYPSTTPDGHRIDRCDHLTGMQEIFTHVAAGHGTSIVGAQGPRYYARPGVTYIPLADAPPYELPVVNFRGCGSPVSADSAVATSGRLALM